MCIRRPPDDRLRIISPMEIPIDLFLHASELESVAEQPALPGHCEVALLRAAAPGSAPSSVFVKHLPPIPGDAFTPERISVSVEPLVQCFNEFLGPRRTASPFVVRARALVEWAGDAVRVSVVTPYCARGSLDALLARAPPGRAGALLLVAGLARALADVAAAQVLHRDVKPANVLVADGPGGLPLPLLADFGCCGALCAGPVATVVGTAGFMAPELRERGHSERSDVFSFGLTAVCALAGLTQAALGARLPLADFPALPAAAERLLGECGCEPWLAALVGSCVAPERAARPPFAELAPVLWEKTRGSFPDEVAALFLPRREAQVPFVFPLDVTAKSFMLITDLMKVLKMLTVPNTDATARLSERDANLCYYTTELIKRLDPKDRRVLIAKLGASRTSPSTRGNGIPADPVIQVPGLTQMFALTVRFQGAASRFVIEHVR
jgi:serine/threonine protein kinase